MNQLIEEINAEQMKKDIPAFNPGDTVRVAVKVIEGEKERVQLYEGVVVGRKGRGLSETFAVLRREGGYQTHRTFFVHSPRIELSIVRRGKVRRAKLTYLAGKTGAKSRIKDRIEG